MPVSRRPRSKQLPSRTRWLLVGLGLVLVALVAASMVRGHGNPTPVKPGLRPVGGGDLWCNPKQPQSCRTDGGPINY